ncbi:hypothetical protein H9651_11930 [Microbacterium sp. Sa4CUA7]|uniref:Uncharacterized protein n=1 Tax=Microbacterium pullorum TaxID=2762236 RepID=A0ABR8S4E5_9MICO|nr:hypothetical protein [Microbacterium pullorum]MBD7958353.1 hypothetical protein [Microbacterium pullorum]
MTTSAWWESVPLHEALLVCAGQHASAAYEVQGKDDPREASFAAARASIHAGAAVELLAKSLLAKEHPALIMEKPADAVPAKRHPLELARTADAGALQRMLCRHLKLGKEVEDLGAGILNDRNNAAPVGLSTHGLAGNVDRLGLWIHFVQDASGLVSTDWLSSKAAREQERRFNAFVLELHEKLVAAKRVFEKRRSDRQKASKDFEDWAARLERELAESAHNEIGPDFDNEQECPACARTGRTWGVIHDIEYEYEGPGEYSQNVIWSSYFKCPVCTLELNDPESTAVFSPGWSDLRIRFESLAS